MRSGFSLVELAIVITIIGLLSAGIIGAQSLIKASEIRSLIQQMGNLRTSTNAFRDRYFAWPGDMPNAVKYWGAQAGTLVDGPDFACVSLRLPTPAITNPDPHATCNGDNDKLISGIASLNGVGTSFYERCRYWQHLSNAGLIEGTFTGICRGGNYLRDINVPSTKMGTGFFQVVLGSELIGAGYSYSTLNKGNILVVTGGDNVPNITMSQPLLAPADAWKIDTKMDDAAPGTGNIQSANNAVNTVQFKNCVDSTIAVSAQYNLNLPGRECIMFFALGK